MMKVFPWIAAGLLLSLSGCGGSDGGKDLPATVDATGVALLDGNPVEGASIVCVPADGAEYPAFASTDSKGRFELKAFEAKDGAVPGSYQLQISKTIEVAGGAAPKATARGGDDAQHAVESGAAGVSWKNELPKQYASIGTSGFSIEITEDGTSDIRLEMTSAP